MKEIDFKSFMKRLSPDNLLPVYYFYGKEEFFIDKAIEGIRSLSGADDFPEFNIDIFYGSEAKAKDVISQAKTLPVMAKKRFILVKEAEGIPKNDLSIYTEYLKSPSPTTVLIFKGNSINYRLSFFKILGEMKALISFRALRDDELISFVVSLARKDGKTISPLAAKNFLDIIGRDLMEISQELKKVILFVGEKEIITEKDIRELIFDKGGDLNQFANAIISGDLKKSINILDHLYQIKPATPLFLFKIAELNRNIIEASEMLNRGMSENKVIEFLNLWGKKGKYILQKAKEIPLSSLKKSFINIGKIDMAVKSSSIPEQKWLEEWIFEFFLN